jgi:hypothetical protein
MRNNSVSFVESTMIRMCVVYNPKNGEIVHIHEYLALPGVTPPTGADLELQAAELACRSTGKEGSDLAFLHARTEDLKVGVEHVVNLRTKTLVVKDRPSKKGQ